MSWKRIGNDLIRNWFLDNIGNPCLLLLWWFSSSRSMELEFSLDLCLSWFFLPVIYRCMWNASFISLQLLFLHGHNITTVADGLGYKIWQRITIWYSWKRWSEPAFACFFDPCCYIGVLVELFVFAFGLYTISIWACLKQMFGGIVFFVFLNWSPLSHRYHFPRFPWWWYGIIIWLFPEKLNPGRFLQHKTSHRWWQHRFWNTGKSVLYIGVWFDLQHVVQGCNKMNWWKYNALRYWIHRCSKLWVHCAFCAHVCISERAQWP